MDNRGIKLAAATAFAAVMAAGAAQAQTKIIFNSFAPPTFVINQGMIDVWAKKVGEVTEGRVVVEIPAQSLAPPQQQWEMVTQGVADATYIFNAFALNRLKLPQLAHLPFINPSAKAQGVALWRTYKKFFEPAKEYEGVVLLGYFGSAGGKLWSMMDKPIAKAEDLKNVKTWSLPGEQARAIGELGAVVVPGPAVRSYEIISKGLVDAFASQSVQSAYSFNVAQYAKSMTDIPGNMGAAAFSVFINKDKWASIPKKDQDLIMSISGEELANYGQVWDNSEAAARKKMVDEGKIQIVKPSDAFMAELRKAWAFLADEWIAVAKEKGVDGKAALEFYTQTAQEIAKTQPTQ